MASCLPVVQPSLSRDVEDRAGFRLSESGLGTQRYIRESEGSGDELAQSTSEMFLDRKNRDRVHV